MKTILKTVSLAVLCAGLTLTSCKKDKKTDSPTTPTDETSTFAQQSNDVTTSNTVSDMSMDDAENVVGVSSLGGFKTTSYPGLCNATVDTTLISQGIATINYNGASCDGLRNRTGSITLHIVNYTTGSRWKNAGAVLTITYNAFTVTSIATGKSTILNGTHTITNVSGGLVNHIGVSSNPSTIVRRIRTNNMTLTFDDGTQRTWSVARKRTWTGSAGVPASLTIEGDTTLSGNANTELWGTNRAGHSFSTVINTGIVVTSACGWYAPVSGIKTHYFNSRVSSVTFGTDASGNPVSTGCPNHYKINWTSLTGVAESYIGTY